MVLKVEVLQTEANSKRELMTTDPSGKMITHYTRNKQVHSKYSWFQMPIDKTTAGGKFFNMSFFNYLFSYALSSVSMF